MNIMSHSWNGKHQAGLKNLSFFKIFSALLLVGGGISIYYSNAFLNHNTSTTSTVTTVWSVLWSHLMTIQMGTDWGNFLAAVVAVGGYLLDAWNNRKYRQLEAQMERVSAQSRNLLVPITMQFHSLHFSALQFIDRHMTMDCIQQYLDYCNNDTDNKNKNTSTKHPRFIKNAESLSKALLEECIEAAPPGLIESPTQLRHPATMPFFMVDCMMKAPKCSSLNNHTDYSVFESIDDSISSTESTNNTKYQQHSLLKRQRRAFATTTPYEFPRPLHYAILECDKPHSALWKSYQSFIRREFIPAVDRISSIIDEHGNLMEPVPSSRLREIFRSSTTGYGQAWDIAPRMWFYSAWLSYARSWQTVLDSWDDPDATSTTVMIRPQTPFPVGILMFNIEAQGIVARVEKKLVGMSQMHGDGD